MTILDSDTVRLLLDRLAGLHPDTPPLWGKMNAHQMICHLNDTMWLAMGEREVTDTSTAVSRTFFCWIALRVPFPWPKGYPTRPEFDQFLGGTRPTAFHRDRTTLGAALQRFVCEPREFDFGRHPVFGAMTAWEWKRWAYLHADHHLRQFGL